MPTPIERVAADCRSITDHITRKEAPAGAWFEHALAGLARARATEDAPYLLGLIDAATCVLRSAQDAQEGPALDARAFVYVAAILDPEPPRQGAALEEPQEPQQESLWVDQLPPQPGGLVITTERHEGEPVAVRLIRHGRYVGAVICLDGGALLFDQHETTAAEREYAAAIYPFVAEFVGDDDALGAALMEGAAPDPRCPQGDGHSTQDAGPA